MMNIRSCQNCQYLPNEDFKQVANLKNSGLIIYIHDNKSKRRGSVGDRNGSNIILHNTSDRDIKRFDYIVELCQYRTKCLRCKMLIQRVRNTIDDVSIINKNEVMGVCDFCKRSHQKNKCRRCQYIVEKYKNNKAIQIESRDEMFKTWLLKMKEILISVLEAKVICKHNICLDYEYKTQLYRLLNSLNSPIPSRQPEIDAFPKLFDLKETGINISESRKILEDLATQLKHKGIAENTDVEYSFSSSGSESECICKYFITNKSKDKPEPSVENVPKEQISLNKMTSAKRDENESTSMTPAEHQKHYKSQSNTITEKPSTGQKSKMTEVSKKIKKRILKSNKENDTSKENINEKKGKEQGKQRKGKKERQNSEYRLMMQMLKEREKEKKVEQLGKNKKNRVVPTIKELPVLKSPKRRVIAEDLDIQNSESILECKDKHLHVVTKMIKGTEIVHLDSHYLVNETESEKLPLLYKVRSDISTPKNKKVSVTLPVAVSSSKQKKHENEVLDAGVTRYELSNRKFIDKGWTKLPSTKVMRRMNIYKMLPASAKYDWFQNYKKQEYLFYKTGEKFAEINEAGGGKWFYKNGNVALDAHRAADSSVKRYVVYSSGDENVIGKKDPITILACFDYLGNGVVYDCYGNVRLKYNQSEGLLIDKKISAPGRWKWHTLNDPPVLQQVFLNTYDKSEKSDYLDYFHTSDDIKKPNKEMIAIELDNFVKEKAHKLLQKFKPFQIRIKVLKINNHFSLRIIDQANIFLLFRCEEICFKLSIGLFLKSDEIIDTDIAEMSEVTTPYDKFPPSSPSLINIQNTLRNVRKYYASFKKNKLKYRSK